LLAVYVSGHGYGHATRTAEVLRAVRERSPALPMAVATKAPAFLFTEAVAAPISVREVACDVGLAQKDALVMDLAATAARWRAFRSGWDDLVAREVEWLGETRARLVFGDVPPLAPAVATAAGLPSVALGNFSWDWVYAHLAREEPALGEAASFCRDAYRLTTLLLRLPFAGDLGAFPRVEDVPLVARRPAVPRNECRRRLALDTRPAVLLSFGGVGMPDLDPVVLGDLSEWQILVTGRVREGAALPPHVRRLGGGDLAGLGLGYPDLVGAVDVVVSKPGYGIVSDCIGTGTRLVYTDRGDFPEYPILVREMAGYIPVAFVSNGDLRSGRLREAVLSVLARPVPPPPALDGADRAASRILELLSA